MMPCSCALSMCPIWSSKKMCGQIISRRGPLGAPARKWASSNSRPQLLRVFRTRAPALAALREVTSVHAEIEFGSECFQSPTLALLLFISSLISSSLKNWLLDN
ncbi:hypothetical protein JZ751_010281 [Albula glossodonta]|uniref:Uncharacterized protein n=1 Tax=Albula glossodonta TaxID=121402 RepID=A0A8T2MT28_9TELE|nr:hypothetical protein JZ751_010281 [Albula glossodonta]